MCTGSYQVHEKYVIVSSDGGAPLMGDSGAAMGAEMVDVLNIWKTWVCGESR